MSLYPSGPDYASIQLAMQRSLKPRARYSAAGIGYWVCGRAWEGTYVQGIGKTLPEAFNDYQQNLTLHRGAP